MQILGKRSKTLLIVVSIAMLVAIGVSFAVWDSMLAVKASNGDLSSYSNAEVGDVIKFGQYYQTGIKDEVTGAYEKTPIEWIVVDKDERTGQLTLMSKYILAAGSYFGNYYYKDAGAGGFYYNTNLEELSNNPYNQAYIDSTARAYLNNLERHDLGGDGFISGKGYVPSNTNSTINTGLLSSVGFSNQRYCTELNYDNNVDKQLVDAGNTGLIKREGQNVNDIYYQRPINNTEYKNRPAILGFYNEAFNDSEKSLIVPKVISGYIGHRWPDNVHNASLKSYVEGPVDKVWLPSATELNVMNGKDANGQMDDKWTSASDMAGSTVFEYYKNLEGDELANALIATRTKFAENSFAMNYSIPVYKKGTTAVNTEIHATRNSTDQYWTRSSMSYWFTDARLINNLGLFAQVSSCVSDTGVRPCIILKY